MKNKNRGRPSRKKSLLMYLIIAVITFFVTTVIVYSVLSIIEFKELKISWDLFKNQLIYSISGVITFIVLIAVVCYSIYYDMFGTSRLLNKTEDARSEIYGDARFLTPKEIKTEFGYYNFADLENKNVSGYVINSERKKNNLYLSVVQDSHALMVGVTGDGKSLRYLGMCLQLNAKSNLKPTLIINDAKGELFDKHSKELKNQGYTVYQLNGRNPERSMKSNYMALIWDLYMESKQSYDLTQLQLDEKYQDYIDNAKSIQSKEIFVAQRLKKAKTRKTTQNLSNEEIEKLYNDYLLSNNIKTKEDFYKDWKKEMNYHKEECLYRSHILTLELARIVVPDGVGENKQWTDGAQGIFAGILIALLEDTDYGSFDITKDMFVIKQVSNIVNRQRESFFEFLKLRPKNSKVFDYCGPIIENSSSKTVDSYLSTLSAALRIYLEEGMTYMLSGNDIDYKTLITQPTAVFMLVPDEYPSRHVVSTLMISQLYNELINQSSKYEQQRLPRPVYFMLDELGNLPKIPDFHKWITISKSRNIFFNIVVQAISQIEAVYGKENSKTIIQNCSLQMLMGSNEDTTVDYFQKRFGNRTIIKRSANYSPKTSVTSYQGSSNVDKVPLVSVDKLRKIEPGYMYWSLLKKNPAKTKLEIIYDLTDILTLGKIDSTMPYRKPQNDYYNLDERNNLLKTRLEAKNKKPDENGGDIKKFTAEPIIVPEVPNGPVHNKDVKSLKKQSSPVKQSIKEISTTDSKIDQPSHKTTIEKTAANETIDNSQNSKPKERIRLGERLKEQDAKNNTVPDPHKATAINESKQDSENIHEQFFKA